jgi:c-di-GMP-binding flagellar brake protein YcgR
MREKRRFIRFEISLKVNYTIQKEPKLEKTGITKDVSAGGIQLLSEDKINVGNKIELKIFIPEALNPVHLSGIALWSHEAAQDKKPCFCTGIEFGKIEEDNKNTFLKFLCDLMYRKIGERKGG